MGLDGICITDLDITSLGVDGVDSLYVAHFRWRVRKRSGCSTELGAGIEEDKKSADAHDEVLKSMA